MSAYHLDRALATGGGFTPISLITKAADGFLYFKPQPSNSGRNICASPRTLAARQHQEIAYSAGLTMSSTATDADALTVKSRRTSTQSLRVKVRIATGRIETYRGGTTASHPTEAREETMRLRSGLDRRWLNR